MVDITVTATSVVKSTGAQVYTGTLGETVTAGQSVYLKTSTGLWMKAQSDGTAEESGYGTLCGIALNGGAINQPVVVQFSGRITIGATVAIGTIYCVSDTAGGIIPMGDLSSSEYTTVLGTAVTTGIIEMSVLASGVEVP